MRHTSLRTSQRASDLALSADEAWGVVASGEQTKQWYVDAAPLVLRGAIDRALGGGGRRWQPPGTPLLAAGDRAGFWEVVEADSVHRRLVLDACVRAPGRVVLRTTVSPTVDSGCRVHQSVTFMPRGLLGRAYLLSDLPARELVLELVHRRLLADLRR